MPLRLTREDFDAYLPECAGSTAAAHIRLSLWQRMVGWGRSVVRRLAALEIQAQLAPREESSGQSGRGTETQRLALQRGPEERMDPGEGRAQLALLVDAVQVEVALELPVSASLDLKNLRARLKDPERNLELCGALEALPEQFTAGLAAESGAAASSLDGTAVLSLLDRSASTGRALRIGWTVPRVVAIVHSSLLDEQLEDAIVALATVYKLIAWAPDNDLLAGARVAIAARRERARSRADAEREHASWEERSRARRRARARSREDEAERPSVGKVETDGKRKREPVSTSSPPRAPATKPGRPRLSVAARGPASEVDSRAPVERGARVRVLAGPFAGKVGIVQELDGKGRARVMLGLLATSLKVKDLVASDQRKGRPTLSSSHRKPLPAR
jgi:hypothetical protein